MLPFFIKLTDGVPASDQLVLAVRKAILLGQLKEGTPFPSVRSISQDLVLSPTTVHKAVTQLKDEGLLAARPGVGMVVRTEGIPDEAARLKMLQPALDAFVREASALGLSPQEVGKAVVAALQKKLN